MGYVKLCTPWTPILIIGGTAEGLGMAAMLAHLDLRLRLLQVVVSTDKVHLLLWLWQRRISVDLTSWLLRLRRISTVKTRLLRPVTTLRVADIFQIAHVTLEICAKDLFLVN